MKINRKHSYYYDNILENNLNSNLVLYSKKSFFPAIQIEVTTIEKSRDDIGVLELTILKILDLGIQELDKIAKLTGFNKIDKLNALIDEMIGYGMITFSISDNKLSISEIGKESIKCGHQLIATKASLLLCGITGNLLPKQMYGAKRVEANELSSCIGFKYLIDEEPEISLDSLNLNNIEKRKYNIKDEVEYISDYDDYSQVFLEADILIKTAPNNGLYKSELSINKQQVDWAFDSKELIDEIKLDTVNLYSLSSNLNSYFRSFEFNKISINELDFNSIEIEVLELNEKYLKKEVNSHPFLAYLGTLEDITIPEQLPIPLNNMPFKQNKNDRDKKLNLNLQGQMVYLTIKNKDILNKAIAYRKIYEIKLNYYKQPYKERDVDFQTFFNEKINKISFEKGLLKEIINDYLPSKFKNLLN